MTDADYNINQLVSTLASISKKYPEGSLEQEAIERAQIALLYVRQLRKEEDLSRYYREYLDPNYKLTLDGEFSTREEAEAWLASGKAAHAMRVKIAGKGFQVAELPGGRRLFIDAPLMSELKKDSGS